MKYDHAKPLIERLMHVAVLYHASSGMLRTKIFDALKEFIPDMDDGCFERGCPAIDHFSSHTTTRDDELKEMVEKGTKAWSGTPDNWVDELRGGVEKQKPDDDIYDIWVEQGTSQENRQVAKNATTERVQVGTRLGPSQDQVGTRIWVGLTDQEIYDIREDHTYNDEEFNEWGFAKDIEAKLKEKNT